MVRYEADILKHLGDHPWAGKLIVLDQVGSTNTYAKVQAARRASHGTVVIADHQTEGRGRMGRSFHSAKGLGLYCSVIFRLRIKPEDAMVLTVLAAEAARLAILDTTGVDSGIKWINDLICGGRKLCGILTETAVSSPEKLDYAVVGIGINCNQTEDDFSPEVSPIAVSLRQITGNEIDRSALAAALLRRVEEAFRILTTDSMPWLESYRSHCITLGREVRLIRGNEIRSAYAEDMDDRGALVVTLADGTRETVCSGEVSVRGMYDYL